MTCSRVSSCLAGLAGGLTFIMAKRYASTGAHCGLIVLPRGCAARRASPRRADEDRAWLETDALSSSAPSLPGAIFPAGVIAVMSAAMVLFYLYNMLAGGNPPPKPKAAEVKAA